MSAVSLDVNFLADMPVRTLLALEDKRRSAQLLLAACATPPDPELCRIARADVAAGESCLAEPSCAAKWDSPTFRLTIDNARDDARRYCGGAK